MKKLGLIIIIIILLLALAACSNQEQAAPTPTVEPATAEPEMVEVTEVAEPAETTAVSAADIEIASQVGINPNHISLNMQGLPYSWQPNLVAGTPYDAGQPPGPVGLPAHVQINFGASDPAQRQPGDPIMYIIPVDAYKNLWDGAQNDAVTQSIDGVFDLTKGMPFPPPASGVPVLPFEEVSGFNDLAVQVDQPVETDLSAAKSGYRFVGRFGQDPSPVSNEGMRYIYQGFTNDGRYLVTFFYPAVTEFLPDSAADVSQEEMNEAAADAGLYLGQKANELNALEPSAWDPDLNTLDNLVSSLTIVGMPATGIEGRVWQLVAESDGTTEEALGNTENYTAVFHPNGELNYMAGCNSGSGTYHALGGAVGSLAAELEPSTSADCGSGSYSSELVETLTVAQDYAVRPGGSMLELTKPDGGSLLFRNGGLADSLPEDAGSSTVELPAPDAQAPYARVTASGGVNIRTGPGTNYPLIGAAVAGEEGPVVGRSNDGLWWAVSLEGASADNGWVSGSAVQVFNTENVPVLESPPPPAPTATPVPPTPTPAPTKQPSSSSKAKIRFTADRKKINAGECAVLVWQVKNIQAVWVYPSGLSYKDFPATGEGAQEVCPSETTTYKMKVLKKDGSVAQKKVKIKVNAPVAVQLPG